MDESSVVHAYHFLFLNRDPRTSAVPAPELSTEAFRAAAKAALMARVKADARAPETDEEKGPKKATMKQQLKATKERGAGGAGEEEARPRPERRHVI